MKIKSLQLFILLTLGSFYPLLSQNGQSPDIVYSNSLEGIVIYYSIESIGPQGISPIAVKNSNNGSGRCATFTFPDDLPTSTIALHGTFLTSGDCTGLQTSWTLKNNAGEVISNSANQAVVSPGETYTFCIDLVSPTSCNLDQIWLSPYIICSECADTPHPDLEPLMKFYEDMRGDTWTNNTNWDPTGDISCNPCKDNWFGVVCRERRVVEINLPNNNLDMNAAFLNLKFDQLTHLEKINLSGNDIFGGLGVLAQIPSIKEIDLSNCGMIIFENDIYTLANLETLKLSGNNLSGIDGPTANHLYDKLTYIDLSNNSMGGFIGGQWNATNFPNLETLLLNDNNLGWCLFPSIQTLCGRNVDISNNSALSEDDFSKVCNEDSGICPPTSTTCTHLDWEPLSLLYGATGGDNTWNNQWDVFNSCDPCGDNWYGVNCENNRVTSLQLCGNGLAGPIPSELYTLTELRELHLCDNQLSGQVSSAISQLSKLEQLDLGNNNLQGDIPEELWSMNSLGFLALGSNGFTGSIPSDISNLTNLWLLNLRSNNFNSIDLDAIGNLTNLEILEIQENGLSGELPDIFADLTNLYNLRIHSNSLTGDLPSSLGDNPNLQFVLFQNNNFSGCYPANYKNLCNAEEIDFSNNPNLAEQDFAVFCNSDAGICSPVEECEGDLTLVGDFIDVNTTFHKERIFASNTLDVNSNVTYKASIAITLEPGFHATSGADFLATIEDCLPPINSIITPELEQLQHAKRVVTESLTVYPNPFTDQTTVEYNLTEEKHISLQIVDILGKTVATLVNNQTQPAGEYQETSNLSKLREGTYFIILQKGDQQETQKLMKLD